MCTRSIGPHKMPSGVALNEELGRSVLSSKDAKRARRSRVSKNAFLVEEGNIKISVDKLTSAEDNEIRTIAEERAAAREKTFFGWAVVTAQDAENNDRRVTATPQLTNPYHADIILPSAAAWEREEQKRHAQELADVSRWREAEEFPD